MIRRIRRSLIHNTDRLLIQFHEIPLKRQIADPRHILLTRAPIILEE